MWSKAMGPPPKNEGEGESGEGQGEFVSAIAHQSVVEVYFGDGDGHIDADGESRHTGEQAEKDEQAAEEFREGGKIRGPARESEAGDEIGVVVKSAKDLIVSMADDDGPKSDR
jgi:hypothetical protein